MADDPLDTLAVQVAEDHKASKRRGAKKPAEADVTAQEGTITAAESNAAALGPVEGEGAAELREAVAELGDAIDEADKPNAQAERIEAMAQDAELDTRTLVGDLRDTMLDLFKTRTRVWSEMREDDQRQVAASLQQAAQHLVKSAVQLINGAGDGAFTAKLEKYADGGGLKINLTAESTTDNVLACHAAQGQFVTVRRYDSTPFNAERRPVETIPDEPEMTFEADKDQAKPEHPADDSDLNPFDNDQDPPAGGDDDDDDEDSDDNPNADA